MADCTQESCSQPIEDDVEVGNIQPEDFVEETVECIKRTASLLLDVIKAAPDISSTSEPAQPLTTDELDIPSGNHLFRPQPPNIIGGVPSTNPALPDIDLPDGRVGCSLYVDHLDNYFVLCKKLLQDTLVASKALENGDDDHLFFTSTCVIQPIDTRLIHCMIKGDLSIKYRTDQHVQLILDELWRSQTVPFGFDKNTPMQPAIYIQYLTNSDGVGLDTAQSILLIKRLREYANLQDPDYALQVDTFTGVGNEANSTTVNNGARKYLSGASDTALIPERVKHVHDFCNALRGASRTTPRSKSTRYAKSGTQTAC
jgi:hypothetical protein